MGEEQAPTESDDPIEVLLMVQGVDEDFSEVVRTLSRELGCPVVVRRSSFDPADLVDEERGQIHAGHLLSRVVEEGERLPALRRLGLVAPDLYRPGVTFEFGEALADGPAGILSLHRLREASYCLAPSPVLLRRRVLTESCSGCHDSTEIRSTCAACHP